MKNKNKINAIMFFAAVALGVTAFVGSVFALANPAAIYCKDLGYDYKIEEGPGGQYGVCILPDGSEVDEWQFFEGKTGEKYSYCAQKGYELKVISGEGCPFGGECVVCVLKDGTEVEMKKLMNLEKPINVDVAVCADKNCSQKSKSFTQGETVYFKINNHINLDISSTIKTPGGEIKYLTFENNLAAFQSDEIGEFSLWVNFSERGNKKQKIEKDFVYIKKTDETSPAFICGDGKCEGEENEQNCPQDCLPAKNTKFYILAAAILLAIGIAGFILYRKKAKARNRDI